MKEWLQNIPDDSGGLSEILLQAFEQSFSAVAITEANLEPPGPRFLYVNPAFVEMTGYQREELVGQTPRILQGEKTERRVLDRLKRQISNGEFFRGHTVNYRKDGSEYYVEWNISPILDNEGKILYYISRQKNITDTIELQKQQEKMTVLGEMLEMMVHQWRQPLNTLLMIAGDVSVAYEMDTLSKEEMDKRYKQICQHVQFMNDTMVAFRDFVKPKKQKYLFSIKDSIQKVLFLFQKALSKHNIDVLFEPCLDTPMTRGVDNEFQQVFLSLLANSRDAIVERISQEAEFVQGRVIIECLRDGDCIVITYRDNGGGIPEDKLSQVFDAHFTTKGEQGSGIGLTICRTILQGMDSSIIVGNRGEGAQFVITVPIVEVS